MALMDRVQELKLKISEPSSSDLKDQDVQRKLLVAFNNFVRKTEEVQKAQAQRIEILERKEKNHAADVEELKGKLERHDSQQHTMSMQVRNIEQAVQDSRVPQAALDLRSDFPRLPDLGARSHNRERQQLPAQGLQDREDLESVENDLLGLRLTARVPNVAQVRTQQAEGVVVSGEELELEVCWDQLLECCCA